MALISAISIPVLIFTYYGLDLNSKISYIQLTLDYYPNSRCCRSSHPIRGCTGVLSPRETVDWTQGQGQPRDRGHHANLQ